MPSPIPDGYHAVTTYLTVANGDAALAFYAKAFGAKELFRLTMGPVVAHAEFQIGDSILMLADENPDWGNKGPLMLGGTPTGFCLYVADADAAFAQAVAAGAKVEKPVEDQFYGDRTGTVVDPFGHKWTLATRKETLSPAEMQTRMDAWLKSMQPA